MNKFKEEFFSYPNSLVFRPFRNYELIKREGKGNVWVAIFYIVLLGVIYSMAYNATGFLVNNNNAATYNGLLQFLGITVPIFLLIVSNWSVSTLMNGKGKLREITMVMGYSVYPFIWMYVLGIVYSNIMIADESYIYYLIINIGILLCAFSLLAGMIMIHEYTLKEALFTILCTIIAFIIILFIIFLMFSLYLQIADFVSTLSRELSQRIGGL